MIFSSTLATAPDLPGFPFADLSLGYWDFANDADSVGVVVQQTGSGSVAFTETAENGFNTSINFAADKAFYSGEFSTIDTVTGGLFKQGFVAESSATGTIDWAPVPPAQFTHNTNIVNPPIGTPFFTSAGATVNFVVDPVGLAIDQNNNYVDHNLCQALNQQFINNDFTTVYPGSVFCQLDEPTKTTTLLFSELTATGGGQFAGPVNIYQYEYVDGMGEHTDQVTMILDGQGTSGTVSFQGVLDEGFYGFQADGTTPWQENMVLANTKEGVFTVYEFTAQDTTAAACLGRAQTGGHAGSIVSVDGTFYLTTGGSDSIGSAVYYAAVATPGGGGGGGSSMELTLTSISGSHGSALTLDGTYDYVGASPPTALDIGYLQSDGGTLWVPAAASTIGTTSPVGSFSSLGGTLA